jgi:hypothetical protein
VSVASGGRFASDDRPINRLGRPNGVGGLVSEHGERFGERLLTDRNVRDLMSETTERDHDVLERALERGSSDSLRKRMREFTTEHDASADLETLRREVATGEPLSAIVRRERDERL